MENQENFTNVPVEIAGEQIEGEVTVERIRDNENEEWLPPEENHDEESDEENPVVDLAIVVREENVEEVHGEENKEEVHEEENEEEDHGEKKKKPKKGDDDDALDNFEYEVEADAAVDEFVDEWLVIFTTPTIVIAILSNVLFTSLSILLVIFSFISNSIFSNHS
ncbi:unnamed protein product [Cochlearia groenlandica]